jgi:ribosome assembly protein 4
MIAVAETHQGGLTEGSVFDERLSKKPKTSEAPSQQHQPTTASSSTNIIPSSVIVAFLNIDGIRTGPPIDLPVQSTSKQIEILVNSLLENKDYLPYAFYVHNKEVISSLSDTLMDIKGEDSKQNFEDTISITFQPLSVYRVRPVTRCIETMPGMHITYLYYICYWASCMLLTVPR